MITFGAIDSHTKGSWGQNKALLTFQLDKSFLQNFLFFKKKSAYNTVLVQSVVKNK